MFKQWIRSSAYQRRVLMVSGIALLHSACGLMPDELLPPDADAPPSPKHREPNPDAFQTFGDCDDLLVSIQERALGRIVQRAESMRRGLEDYYGQAGEMFPGDDTLTPQALSDNPLLVSESGLALGSSSARNSPSIAGTEGFSGTTRQEVDVDEADIVKADGQFIYLLQGDVLFKAKAWPAEELEILGAELIEGRPLEMLVHEGRAVVFSRVYRDLQGEVEPTRQYRDYYYYGSESYTKLTVLDVSGQDPEVLRESYLRGDYLSSRRHGDVVRAVVTERYGRPSFDDFYLEYLTPFGEPYRQQDIDAQVDAWLERTSWVISESSLSDWLPPHFEVVDGAPVEQAVACDRYFQSGNTELVSDSSVTQLASLALSAGPSASVGVTRVSGAVSRVYANPEVVLLATVDYGSVDNDYSESTVLHRFDLEGLETQYVASGRAPGRLHDQFSLDEREGVIRLSTTESNWAATEPELRGPVNRVFTLATNGEWLDVWGQTEVFGRNEDIYATRFLGDRGYVVTFRQTDPLFVVDLERPGSPNVVGELHIPGFSNYLYPLGADHLFSVGRDATEDGRVRGVALQIFDVSDATNPTLSERYAYEVEEVGYTYMEVDHRAVSFDPNSDRVVFPLYQEDDTGWGSSLEVFDVSASLGIERLGAIAPEPNILNEEQCMELVGWTPELLQEEFGEDADQFREQLLRECAYYVSRETMVRGLFREDVVFAVSTDALYAQRFDSLHEPPLAVAPLPVDRYGYGGGMMVGVAGSGGFGGGSMMGMGGGAMTMGGGAGLAMGQAGDEMPFDSGE